VLNGRDGDHGYRVTISRLQGLTGINYDNHNHIPLRRVDAYKRNEAGASKHPTGIHERLSATQASSASPDIYWHHKSFKGKAASTTLPLKGVRTDLQFAHTVRSWFFQSGFKPRGLNVVKPRSLVRHWQLERSPYSVGEFGNRNTSLSLLSFLNGMALEHSQCSGAVSFLGPTIGGKRKANPTGEKYKSFPRNVPAKVASFFRDCSRIRNKVQDYLIPTWKGVLTSCQLIGFLR
jgi:hypothetical protein